MVSQLEQNIEAGSGFVIGRDFEITHRVLAPETVRLREDSPVAGVILYCERLDDPLSDGDKLLIGKNMIVTLGDDALAGAQTVDVVALAGPVRSGEVLQKIRDITGYTIEWELLDSRRDTTAIIASSQVTIEILTQTDVDRGRVRITGAAALTQDLTPGRYFYSLWRVDAGFRRPLAYGDIELEAAGALS